MMNPAANGCRVQGFPTVPHFAVSLADVVCLFTVINSGERLLQAHVYSYHPLASLASFAAGNIH